MFPPEPNQLSRRQGRNSPGSRWTVAGRLPRFDQSQLVLLKSSESTPISRVKGEFAPILGNSLSVLRELP